MDWSWKSSLYQLELHNIQLDSASNRDELTGLLNRRLLEYADSDLYEAKKLRTKDIMKL